MSDAPATAREVWKQMVAVTSRETGWSQAIAIIQQALDAAVARERADERERWLHAAWECNAPCGCAAAMIRSALRAPKMKK